MLDWWVCQKLISSGKMRDICAFFTFDYFYLGFHECLLSTLVVRYVMFQYGYRLKHHFKDLES
jgi:hypothetical protein